MQNDTWCWNEWKNSRCKAKVSPDALTATEVEAACSSPTDCQTAECNQLGFTNHGCYEGICYHGILDASCTGVSNGGNYSGMQNGTWCWDQRKDSRCKAKAAPTPLPQGATHSPTVSPTMDPDCQDMQFPLAGSRLPGPYDWIGCMDYTAMYKAGGGHCEFASIQASPQCEADCQSNPGLILARCPVTCGQCESWRSSPFACKSSVTIPNGVVSIGDHAFEKCSSLSSVTIPNSVVSIGSGAFASCSSLSSVTIPNSVVSIGSGAFDSPALWLHECGACRLVARACAKSYSGDGEGSPSSRLV